MAFEHLTNDTLLDALAHERLTVDPDEENMGRMIDELVARSVYPAKLPEGNPNTLLMMVHGWGARWFEFKGYLNCPHCNTDLRSPMGPPFKLEIALYDAGRDRTVGWKCRECEETWLTSPK